MRALYWFWGFLLTVLLAGGVILQILGPPPKQVALAPPAAPVAASPPAPAPAALPPVAPPMAEALAVEPGRDTPGPIASPDPALQELGPMPGLTLPKLAADGRAPMQIYARAFDRTNRRPWIGLVVAGIGLDHAASEAIIHALPGGVTLAFSPYATHLDPLLDAARNTGHEYLLSLPMENALYPQNDPGELALMTGAPPAQNALRLAESLGQFGGYAGVTGALGEDLLGERFAGSAPQMKLVTAELARRGLFYIDTRPGAARLPDAWGRDIDVIVDRPAGFASLQAGLDQLERIARDKGRALGLVMAVKPGEVALLQTWADGLGDRGLALAPASALAERPGTGTEDKPDARAAK